MKTVDRVRGVAKTCGWKHWQAYHEDELVDYFVKGHLRVGVRYDNRGGIRVAHRVNRSDKKTINIIRRHIPSKANRVIEWLVQPTGKSGSFPYGF